LVMDPQGEFHGFFGANPTEAPFFERLKLYIYSEEMLENEIRLLPRAISSVNIDRDGLIYTSTFGAAAEQIKKFNIRSEHLLEGLSFDEGRRLDPSVLPQLVDVAIDSNGNVIAIDQTNSAIHIYSEYGELLFYWAGEVTPGQTRLGLIQSPSAVAVNSANEL